MKKETIGWILLALILIVIGFFVFKSIMHVKEVYKAPIINNATLNPPIEQNGCGDGVEDCKG